MKRNLCILSIVMLISALSVQAVSIGKKDAAQKAAEHEQKVKKEEAKENYKRRLTERVPSGYMTIDEYMEKSMAKDKAEEKVGIPKVERPSDMKYVPQPTYKIVRYNNPPGTPEISIKPSLYQKRQQNAQGIVSPDYKMLVYPAVYYYPNSASVACDLFVIKLDEGESNLNRIMKANVIHREANPILSTDKTIDNDLTFRTLTPVDFSSDSSKLLVKEKIGNTKDGIWQTNAIVYDFTNKISYEIKEIRDAIIYYWKENKNLDLDDKRWDIYPLGFDANNPDRIIINAYAFTGEKPVMLGVWSVDYKGEQSRLISFNNVAVKVGMNGLKMIQDGVVAPSQTAAEEKQQKKIEKADEKDKKKEEKAEIKALQDEYKSNIKEMDEEFKMEQKYQNARNKINGSTSTNDAEQKLQEAIDKIDADAQKAQEKKELRELKINEKKEQAQDKKQQLIERVQQRTEAQHEAELQKIRDLQSPAPIIINENIFND